MEIKIGDNIKVKNGINDIENEKISLGGWTGRVLEIIENYDNEQIGLIYVAWDSLTLKQLPENFIIESEINGQEWAEYNIYISDVELTNERDTIEDTVNVYDMLTEKYAFAHLGEEGKRIMKVLDNVSSDDNDAAFEKWNNHFKQKLRLPEKMEVIEFLEDSICKLGDVIDVEKITTIDDLKGLLVYGKCKGKYINFPLCDLEVINKKSDNYKKVSDYCLWFANKKY